MLLPNRQVLRKTDTPEASHLDALVAVARRIAAAGLDVVVASHEGEHDMALARAEGERVPGARMIEDTSLPVLLGTVRHASLVVSSRFHGLVAALADGTPVVSIGWAAKYRSLLEDFEVPEVSVDVDRDGGDWRVLRRPSWGAALDDLSTLEARVLTARALRLADLDVLWRAVRSVTHRPGR